MGTEKKGSIAHSTRKRPGKEVKQEERTGDQSSMTKEELEHALETVEKISNRKVKGAFYIIHEISQDEEGTNLKATLYSNNISKSTILDCVHDALDGMHEGGIKAIEIKSVEDLMNALKRIRS